MAKRATRRIGRNVSGGNIASSEKQFQRAFGGRDERTRTCEIEHVARYAPSDQKGYITMNGESGVIEFTPEGKKRAEGVYERHRVLKAAIMKLGGSEELAERDGCRIEHVVSDELLELLKKFVAE